MPNIFKREHYILKSYNNEQFKLEYYDEESKTENVEYSNKWEDLYIKAKKLAKQGISCEIWEMRYSLD